MAGFGGGEGTAFDKGPVSSCVVDALRPRGGESRFIQ